MPKTLKKNLEFWLWFIDKGFTIDEKSSPVLRDDLVQCLDLVKDIERWNQVSTADVKKTPSLQATAGFMDGGAAQGSFNSFTSSTPDGDSFQARHSRSRGWEHYVDGKWEPADGAYVKDRLNIKDRRKPHDSGKWTGL